MALVIATEWQGKALAAADHVSLRLAVDAASQALVLSIDAPFYGDPPAPDGPSGKPFQQLWDYEVVEMFFLGEGERYLEVEVSPHGQHLVLALKGPRGLLRDQLPLSVQCLIGPDGKRWTGTATIPFTMLPPGFSKINAYAIHGSDPARVYKSLYPASDSFEQPDFHRLEFFQAADADLLSQLPSPLPPSDLWAQS